MSGPFQKLESLDVPGLDDSLACADGVCAAPTPVASAGERLGEETLLDLAERHRPDGSDGLG